MLTGDENIVDINYSVFWVIKDASKFIFNIQDPINTIKIMIRKTNKVTTQKF